MVTIKQFFIKSSHKHKLGAHQKACPKCQRIMHADLPRCPSCAHAPWIWHSNARFLVIALALAIFLFILAPLLTSRETPYRTPVLTSSNP